MILLTPAETYDPFFAYGLLNRYSKDIQKSAIEKAHSRGVLIKAKGSLRDYRRLPGTFYGLGRKCVTTKKTLKKMDQIHHSLTLVLDMNIAWLAVSLQISLRKPRIMKSFCARKVEQNLIR